MLVARLLCLGGAYIAGSIPFSHLLARADSGVDLRTVSTGTVSATNVYRTSGLRPFLLAGLLDAGKGLVALRWVSRRDTECLPLAVGLLVAGHNWSPFLRGAGGRGISPAIGALAAICQPGAGVLGTGLVLGRLAGETGAGSLLAQCALTPVLARTHGRRGTAIAVGVLVPMLVKRLAGNGPPAQRSPAVYLCRLAYDRDHR